MDRKRKVATVKEAEDFGSPVFEPAVKPAAPVGLPFYVVIGLLIIASFMLGSLYTKVQYLEKGGTVAKNDQAAAPSDNQPPPAMPTIGDVPELSAKDKIRGNKDADVAMIVYTDYECPFCKNFHATAEQVLTEYKDKVKLIYRDYPLGFHANAQKEAEATECANELGGADAFWKYVDAIFARTTSNGTGIALDSLVPLAKELGLNESKFKTCLDSGKYAQEVKDEMTGGQNAGIQGTPGSVVLNLKNGKKESIPGALPIDQVKTIIEKVL